MSIFVDQCTGHRFAGRYSCALVNCVALRLVHRPEAAGRARQACRLALDGWRVAGEPAASVLVVLSELVANAVEHGQPPLSVQLRLRQEHAGRCVWIGITDGGPAAPGAGTRKADCPDDEHGRGLVIVDALAVAYGTYPHASGTTHWACVNVQAAAGQAGPDPL